MVTQEELHVDLSSYRNPEWHDKERAFMVRAIWHCVNAIFLQNPFNASSRVKAGLLRMFGAKIGRGAILKPGINVKQPWKLEMGDHCWIGERAWIDTFSYVKIGNSVCISQDAYICTGNHDWSDPAFGLIEQPVVIHDGAWIGARATVLPGTTIGSHAVITAGAVIAKEAEPYTVYSGNPAKPLRQRVLRQTDRNRFTAPIRP